MPGDGAADSKWMEDRLKADRLAQGLAVQMCSRKQKPEDDELD